MQQKCEKKQHTSGLQAERLIRRKASLIADASINLEKEIQKQVKLFIIRKDLVVVYECR